MKSLVRIFAALILVFSFSGVASAKDEKGTLLLTPEMQLSLVCENDEVSMTVMSLETGIVEKAVNKFRINKNNHEVTLTVVSETDGIVMKKIGRDVMHENIDFDALKAGKYKIVVNYRDNVIAQEIEVR